jgi:hypothetical protein
MDLKFVYLGTVSANWLAGVGELRYCCVCADSSLLALWVRGYCYVVECCVVSGLCDELITYPEESYRLWCVVVCDIEN